MNPIEFLRDKQGNLSFRELAAPILLICLICAWIGSQFLGYQIEAPMYFTLAGTFSSCQLGYSIEKPTLKP